MPDSSANSLTPTGRARRGRPSTISSDLSANAHFSLSPGLSSFETLAFNFRQEKKRELTLPPPFIGTAAIGYLWPAWVIRAMKSRRLSVTVEPKNASRSAALILAKFALTAFAHLSTPSALG